MSLRQAAQQALEAWFRPHGINYVDFKPYMEALRAALAEPDLDNCPKCGGPADNGHDRCIPPNTYFCSKCMAQPEQEPYYGFGIDWGTGGGRPCCTIVKKLPNGVVEVVACEYGPVPTPRKPLSDEQMRALVGNVADIGGAIRIARAIERAHGIGK